MPRPLYTLQSSDVGKRFLRAFGRGWSLSDSIGYVQAHDVGKRVYRVGSPDNAILQVENDEQHASRLARCPS